MHIHLIDGVTAVNTHSWAILHSKPPKSGRGPLTTARIALKNRTLKEKTHCVPDRSRHTRMPSSRHVGGYLMLCCRDDCEEG